MSKLLVGIALGACLFACSSSSRAEEAQRMFVGTAKCKMCHKTPAQGEQYGIWEKGPHAKAYESLASEKAMEVAKKKGIADPQKADECLKCHVTAHGVDEKYLGTKYTATDGVGCESCHGAGNDYKKKKTMIAALKGEIEPASVGLVIPDEKTCVKCHNEESPFYQEFDFEKMAAKISHKMPEERRAKHKTVSQ
ncbi:MAG: multiheme c-type cytochrome [Candidatus Krumholzibacteriia bacterium]